MPVGSANDKPVQIERAEELPTITEQPRYRVASLERKSASTPTTVQYRDRSPYDRPASQMGVEFGIVGRRQSTSGDFLGMQALLGARAFLWLPVYNTFSIKPSFGYFFKKETQGSVTVNQNHLEGGLGLLITVLQEEDFKWNLGLSNRITRATSTSSVFTNSASGPSEIFLRSGPATGLLIRLGGRLHLAADFEYTWSFERPTRSYMGLTSGLAYEF